MLSKNIIKQIYIIIKIAMNIFKKILRNCKTGKLKKINLKSSKGSVSLVIIGIISFVSMCYIADIKTESFIQNAQTQNLRKEELANELNPYFNNSDLNKAYELGNFDPKKAAQDLLPYPENEQILDQYYKLRGLKTLDEAKEYYETQILNNSEFQNKTKNLLDKYLIYDSSGHWPVDMRNPYSDFGSKEGESAIQAYTRQKEEAFLAKQYLLYQNAKELKKWQEEDAQISKDKADLDAEIKSLDLINEIETIIEEQKKLESEKAEIEKNGLANYWIKKVKEKMQETGILADDNTIMLRENFFKSVDWINEIEKLSPQPDWVPEQIALIEENRKWLEANDPLFSNNELVAWLNRIDRDGFEIDPETIASILNTLGITNEASIAAESNESVSENTSDATQPDETTPDTNTQPDETTPDTQVNETTPDATQPDETTPDATQPDETTPIETLTLNGKVTGLLGKQFPLTITISLITGEVNGSYFRSGEGNCVIWELDENGNEIPGSRKQVYAQFEIGGTITGNMDLNTKIINGDMTSTGSVYYEGETHDVNIPGTVLASLDENNNLTGTATNTYTIEASP